MCSHHSFLSLNKSPQRPFAAAIVAVDICIKQQERGEVGKPRKSKAENPTGHGEFGGSENRNISEAWHHFGATAQVGKNP
jgi:hypothetical protein